MKRMTIKEKILAGANDTQKEVIKSIKGSYAVSAGPGSGKVDND